MRNGRLQDVSVRVVTLQHWVVHICLKDFREIPWLHVKLHRRLFTKPVDLTRIGMRRDGTNHKELGVVHEDAGGTGVVLVDINKSPNTTTIS